MRCLLTRYTGGSSLRALFADAHAALDETVRLLAAGGGRAPIVAMGGSLGSAPAIELAASRPGDVAALVVESGFARIIPLLGLLGVPACRCGVTKEHGPRNLEKDLAEDLRREGFTVTGGR